MFVPLTCKTQGSLGLSQTTPEELADFCVKYNLMSTGLCDIGNLSQCVSYYNAMTKVEKKPIFGIQLRICDKFGCVHEDNPTNKRLILIAKNLSGWKQLLLITYESSNSAIFDDGGRLSIEECCGLITDDLIVIASSDLNDIEWELLRSSSKNLWCGINPVEGLVKNPLNINVVPITPNFYLDPKDKIINDTLICDKFGISLEDNNAHPALKSPDYCIQGKKLFDFGFDSVEINNTGKLFNEIEEFSILNDPTLPNYDCPDNLSEYEFLEKNCFNGLLSLNLDKKEYKEKLHHELGVIKSAGMSGYFLVMSDITDFCRRSNILMGYGRGSAAGCLISYCIGITKVDPIKHDLLFERFYSADRGGLPDIDLDIQPSKRKMITDYLCDKYGKDRFMQISTFGTLRGKAAIRCALRVFDHPIEVQNEISKILPQEAKIAAQLEEQEKEIGSSSSILYSLLHNDKLNKWCSIEEVEGGEFKFSGPMAKEFELGIKINSIIKSRSRHASAFVLGKSSLHNTMPITYDINSNSYILDPEMKSCESLGGVKLDLLGLKLLDKYEYARKMLNEQTI